MKVLVVEPDVERRADLVDAICEIPGVEVRGATGCAFDSRDLLANDTIDMVIAGSLSPGEAAYLAALAEHATSELVFATSVGDTTKTVRSAARDRRRDSGMGFERLAARAKELAFERGTRDAGPLALSHRLIVAQPSVQTRLLKGTQTIELREWLPRAIAGMRAVIPEYVDIVALVAADTPGVRCVPAILEHAVLELVLQASAVLVWGGTIWLTAEASGYGYVRLDVIENGDGRILDLTLRSSQDSTS